MVAMTEDEIFDELGGTKAVANLLGCRQNAVSNWRKRGLPAWARLKLTQICEERGITLGPDFYEAQPNSPIRASER